MVVVGGLSGVALLVAAFRRLVAAPASALILGLYWLAINLVLDLIVLMALFRMPLSLYLYDIGLRYLLIPIIAFGMGIAARQMQSGAASSNH